MECLYMNLNGFQASRITLKSESLEVRKGGLPPLKFVHIQSWKLKLGVNDLIVSAGGEERSQIRLIRG
jgi:hypothetical protein